MALLASLLAGVAAAAPPAADEKVDTWLTVLHNNDGESELLPTTVFDADDNVIGTEGGVAYFAAVREAAEAAALTKPADPARKKGRRNAIFVSSGDNFLASPEFTASISDDVFYDAMALDMLDYTAIALGNHDFDFGPDLLTDFISTGFANPGDPPYVSANLDFTGEPGLQALADDDVITASTMVKQKGRWIGIVGATTENLPFISSPRNVEVNAVLPAVQTAIDALTAKGVKIIVMISHLQDIEADQMLAEQLSGVDIMIAGGGDELLASDGDPLLPSDGPGDVFGDYPLYATNADGQEIPVVTTSGSYGYLGNLTVGFNKAGEVIVVDDELSRPIRVVSSDFDDGVEPVGSFVTAIQDPVAEYVEGLAANVIATSEVDLDGRRSPGVRTMETNEGNLIADSQLWQAQQLAASFGVAAPDVAIQNGGGIRNDSIIPAGPISELDTFDMVPFPNFVTIVPDIPRSQFKEILENTVSRTQPGDTPGGTGRFAQIAGFSMTWSGSGTAQVLNPDGTVATAGTRVQEVALDDGTTIVTGGAVVDGPDIGIAIVDFLARGGDEYPFRGAPFTAIGVSYQQALFNYIVGPLGGNITAVDYPVGGEGRNIELP